MADGAVQTKRKVRLGMVGGGPGSNIGETHRYAARIDNRYDLVAGVFATDPARSRDFAQQLAIPPDRRYADWQELVAREADRADGVERPIGRGALPRACGPRKAERQPALRVGKRRPPEVATAIIQASCTAHPSDYAWGRQWRNDQASW